MGQVFWEVLAERISFAYWLESHLRISTGCTFCLWIKSHPPHFSNLCLQILFSFKRKFCVATNYVHQFNSCSEFLRVLLQNCAIRWKSRPWSCCRGVNPQALLWRHIDTAAMRHSNREGESWWWHSLVEAECPGNLLEKCRSDLVALGVVKWCETSSVYVWHRALRNVAWCYSGLK